MKIPFPLKTLVEDLVLFYINIRNLFYNFFIFIPEAFLFYTNKKLRFVDLELFKAYAIKDQFSVSIDNSKQIQEVDSGELTYGEITWLSFHKIAKIINPKPESIFYDLGCGTGRVVFFANIFYKLNATGIDLVPEFIKYANNIKEKCNLTNISFLEANILETDFSNADIIYIAGTCLSDKTWNLLQKKLETLKKGTIILSVSNMLDSTKFKLIKSLRLNFSWGKADVYVLEIV